jgi:putative transposase
MFPCRKTPIHLPLVERFNRPNIVFVTVCTKSRKPILCQTDVYRLLLEAWAAADAWRVGRHVLMPNHLHLLCSPARIDYPSLEKWVQFWKSYASRVWPRREEHPVWLRSFWDTQIRSGKHYEQKLEYIRQNPVRAGLCRSPEDWPFQGELSLLDWYQT